MKCEHLNIKITLFLLTSLLTWPKFVNKSFSCSKAQSFLVRNSIVKKWMPIYAKYKVAMPVECPLHPSRDFYNLFHQAKRLTRHWTCGLCGKSFYTELFLDLHMANRHHEKLMMTEDTTCFSDYCDIFRCDVIQALDMLKTITKPESDAKAKKQAERTVTALVKAKPQSLVPLNHLGYSASVVPSNMQDGEDDRRGQLLLSKSETSNETRQTFCHMDSPTQTASESALDEHFLFVGMRKQQNACHDDDFIPLQLKCAQVLQHCTASLILTMSNKDFQDFQGELHRAACWYLQCDRYWQEVWSSSTQAEVNILVFTAAISFLTLGLAASYCIMCILCPDVASDQVNRAQVEEGNIRKCDSHSCNCNISIQCNDCWQADASAQPWMADGQCQHCPLGPVGQFYASDNDQEEEENTIV